MKNNQLIEKLESTTRFAIEYLFDNTRYTCQSFVDILNKNCEKLYTNDYNGWTIDNVKYRDCCFYNVDKREFGLCKHCELFVSCRNFHDDIGNENEK